MRLFMSKEERIREELESEAVRRVRAIPDEKWAIGDYHANYFTAEASGGATIRLEISSSGHDPSTTYWTLSLDGEVIAQDDDRQGRNRKIERLYNEIRRRLARRIKQNQRDMDARWREERAAEHENRARLLRRL